MLLADSRVINCFLQRRPGWPIWLVSRGLRSLLERGAARASSGGSCSCLTLFGHPGKVLSPAWEDPTRLGPGPIRPTNGSRGTQGPFQGLKSMVQVGKLPESDLEKVPSGGITTQSGDPVRGDPKCHSRWGSRLRVLSGSWLQTVIYYGIIRLRCQDCCDFFNGFFPRGLSPEAPNVSSGRRKHSRTPMSEPDRNVWGPEMALTPSGGLGPAARLAAHPISLGSQLVLRVVPVLRANGIVPERSRDRAKETTANQCSEGLCRMCMIGSHGVAGLVQIVRVRTIQSGDSVCDGAIFQEVLEAGDRHLLASCFLAPPRGPGAHVAIKSNAY